MNRYLKIVRDELQSAPPLTLPELFADCNRLGLTLQRRGDSIRFAGDLTMVTPELQTAIEYHEAELLGLLGATSPSNDHDSSGNGIPASNDNVHAGYRHFEASEDAGDFRNEAVGRADSKPTLPTARKSSIPQRSAGSAETRTTASRTREDHSQNAMEEFVLGDVIEDSKEDQQWHVL